MGVTDEVKSSLKNASPLTMVGDAIALILGRSSIEFACSKTNLDFNLKKLDVQGSVLWSTRMMEKNISELILVLTSV